MANIVLGIFAAIFFYLHPDRIRAPLCAWRRLLSFRRVRTCRFVEDVRRSLYTAKIAAYAQGLALYKSASEHMIGI